MEKEIFSLKEAADYLGKPRSWLYNNIGILGIPHVKIGQQYRFIKADLRNWLEGLK
jgi:excisionase family DNA binding protein